MLREANRNESIQELLSNDKSYQRIKQERTTKLSELIEKEMKLMRYRKPFWAWMVLLLRCRKQLSKRRRMRRNQKHSNNNPRGTLTNLWWTLTNCLTSLKSAV